MSSREMREFCKNKVEWCSEFYTEALEETTEIKRLEEMAELSEEAKEKHRDLRRTSDPPFVDVRYECGDCGKKYLSVGIAEALEEADGSLEKKQRLRRTLMYNFNRARKYPLEFSPRSLPCLKCEESIQGEKFDSRAEPSLIIKDTEPSEYIHKMAELCPKAWMEDHA